MILFKTELGERLGNKTLLIGLAGHRHVEDHRRDTLPRQAAFVGGDIKLSANAIKGVEHSPEVMRLERTRTWAGSGNALIHSMAPNIHNLHVKAVPG